MEHSTPRRASTTIIAETLRAMAQPRRLVPVLLLAAALIVAQTLASHAPRAGWVGLAVVAATLLLAPTGWRLALELPGAPRCARRGSRRSSRSAPR